MPGQQLTKDNEIILDLKRNMPKPYYRYFVKLENEIYYY